MNVPISFHVLNKIKREAKAIKSKYPTKSHAQRLDIASNTIIGVSTFYEVHLLHEKYLSLNCSVDDGLVLCEFCRFTFVGDNNEDQKEHMRRHELFEKAKDDP